MTFTVELVVRPRRGVRDPQGDAVEESLRGMGYAPKVHGVGRCLLMDLDATSQSEAEGMVHDMCKRLLVNPNLETYDLTVVPKAPKVTE